MPQGGDCQPQHKHSLWRLHCAAPLLCWRRSLPAKRISGIQACKQSCSARTSHKKLPHRLQVGVTQQCAWHSNAHSGRHTCQLGAKTACECSRRHLSQDKMEDTDMQGKLHCMHPTQKLPHQGTHVLDTRTHKLLVALTCQATDQRKQAALGGCSTLAACKQSCVHCDRCHAKIDCAWRSDAHVGTPTDAARRCLVAETPQPTSCRKPNHFKCQLASSPASTSTK